MLKYMLLGLLLSKCFLLEQFCGIDYLIAYNYWIINNTSYIFTIFTITCCRIPNTIFFTYYFCEFSVYFLNIHSDTYSAFKLLIQVTFFTIKLTFTFAWYMFCKCSWFVYSCYLIKHAGLNLLFHLEHILY